MRVTLITYTSMKSMMEAQTIAEKILKMSKSVRFVTVCDTNGRLVFSAHPKGVKSKVSPKESKKSLVTAARAWKTRKELSRKLGMCKYVLAEYDKVKRITMPAGKNHLLYITTSPNLDHNKIIRRVRQFR